MGAFVKLPWVDPGVWRFFFQGQTWVIICTRSSWKTKTPHTGFDPGKLNERTHRCPNSHCSQIRNGIWLRIYMWNDRCQRSNYTRRFCIFLSPLSGVFHELQRMTSDIQAYSDLHSPKIIHLQTAECLDCYLLENSRGSHHQGRFFCVSQLGLKDLEYIIVHFFLVLYSGWLKHGHVEWTNIG